MRSCSDSYRIGPAELDAAAPVVAFHDAGREPAGAVLVVDGANFDHACLQQPYWDLPARELSDTVGLVVVAVGAAGDFGDYAGLGAARASDGDGDRRAGPVRPG